MAPIRIDLFSDTVTRPTDAMRQAMVVAEVGDEQKFEDPTTNRLQERVAELLGKEAALYLPSGTMCNQIGFRLHCRQGDEAIADWSSHPVHAEVGGYAALSGVAIFPVHGERGIYDATQLEAAIRDPVVRHRPRSALVWIEQTTNMGGGAVWPLATIRVIASVAGRHGLRLHMDGARLMNAVVASGVSAADFAAPFDTVWIDFSKGLGAPIGAALAGSKEFIAEAWRIKQQLGGAMRQSGIVAAACLHALDHHVERLAEDHANARVLADRLSEIEGISVERVETNIVLFDVEGLGLTGSQFIGRLLERGVRVSPGLGPTRLRAVTHLDVSLQDIGVAMQAIHEVVDEAR